MKYALPTPIASNYSYEAVLIENVKYDGTQYTADVFGIVDGQPIPLIFKTAEGLIRIPQCTITDEEINAVMAAHPEITVRLDAGLVRAMERLYELIGAQPNA
ncbi:MAG: hypothetical protein WCS52_01890 [bacterium]